MRWTWHGRGAEGGRVALGTRSCFLSMLVTKNFKDPFGYHYYYRANPVSRLLNPMSNLILYPVPYTTVYITPAPPGPMFHGRNLHSWSSAGAKTVGVGNISLRAFRRRIVWYWHPLGCRATELGKRPQGGVIYTVVYGYSALYPGISCTAEYCCQCVLSKSDGS